MILKLSDFVDNEYIIPNVGDDSIMSDKLGSSTLTQWIIDKYENSMIIKLLGFELYTLLKAQIDLTETNRLKPTADVRFKNLLNGKDQYLGLVNALTSYIHYQYLRIRESNNTSLGIKISQSKSSSDFGPRTKAVDAYNEFVYSVVGDNNSNPIVTDWGGSLSVIHSSGNNHNKCIYQFLKDNKSDYPEWTKFSFNDVDFTLINSFDL